MKNGGSSRQPVHQLHRVVNNSPSVAGNQGAVESANALDWVSPAHCCVVANVSITVTSLPWPHRQMYSCIRQKGGRTSSKSPRRRVAKIPEFQKDNHSNVQNKMRGQ